MVKWSLRDIGLAVLFSYILITALNYILNQGFGIPVIRTGSFILLFLVGCILGSMWIFLKDGKLEAEEIKGLIVVIVLVVAIYFGIRYALPELFSSIAPQRLQEVMDNAFSFLS